MRNWSFSLGRWWGVPVRLHIFFLLFVVLAFAFLTGELLWDGMLALTVLFVSIVLHEIGHALATHRVGGKVDAIVLSPVGGLVAPRVPDEPDVQVFVAISGPIVHLALVVGAAIAIAIGSDAQAIVELLNPVIPAGIVEGDTWLVVAKLTLWINWVLMLLNLLPAYPFDGGPVMRALLWPALGRKTASIVTSRVAMVIAVGLCVYAVFGLDTEAPTHLPLWVPFLMLGIFLFFSARQDQIAAESIGLHDELIGYRASNEGLDLLDAMWSGGDEQDAVLVEQRKDSQGEVSEQHPAERETSEDARVDDILARLHTAGLKELSREELEILQRASRRYRSKRRSSKDAE